MLPRQGGVLNFVASLRSDEVGKYGMGAKDIKEAVRRVLKRKK
tara:strand:+ start:8612 stop:8740 length:129 start_codon:yes stop_codon:yes gene_type:complete